MLQEAAQEAEGAAGGGQGGATACRVLYRLAHYADGLYRNIEASRCCPCWDTPYCQLLGMAARLTRVR